MRFNNSMQCGPMPQIYFRRLQRQSVRLAICATFSEYPAELMPVPAAVPPKTSSQDVVGIVDGTQTVVQLRNISTKLLTNSRSGVASAVRPIFKTCMYSFDFAYYSVSRDFFNAQYGYIILIILYATSYA
jgi:hypothetical protein